MTYIPRVKKQPLTAQDTVSGRRVEGFTLLEVLIVLSIVGIMTLGIRPAYESAIMKAREAALKKNLYLIREALDAYYVDHRDEDNENYYPGSLKVLTEGKYKYLRYIPEDPLSKKSDWELIYDEDGEGIYDIRSTSGEVGSNGKIYREW